MNGDGKVDLVANNGDGNRIDIMYNLGDCTLQYHRIPSNGPPRDQSILNKESSWFVTLADLDRDGGTFFSSTNMPSRGQNVDMDLMNARGAYRNNMRPLRQPVDIEARGVGDMRSPVGAQITVFDATDLSTNGIIGHDILLSQQGRLVRIVEFAFAVTHVHTTRLRT